MKKIVSLFIILVIAVSLLPFSANAKGIAITRIELTGFAEPNNSLYPGYTLVLPDDAHYKLDTKDYTNGILWTDVTDGKILSPTDKFIEAHEYKAVIHLVADYDYYFYKYQSESGIIASVNGVSCKAYYLYESEKYVEVVYYPKVVGAEKLEGSIELSYAPFVDINSTLKLSGAVAYVPISKLKYQWQISDEKTKNFQNINGATKSFYTPTEADYGRYLRAKLTAEGCYNYLYTPAQMITKQGNAKTPKAPEFLIEDGDLFLINCRGDQEYLLTVSEYQNGGSNISEENWAKSYKPKQNEKLILVNDGNGTYYVYTRFKETGAAFAGVEVAYSKIFCGETVYTKEIVIKCNTKPEYIKVGGSVEFAASALPSNATNFEGIRGSDWLINYRSSGSEYGAFYENSGCTKPIDPTKYYYYVYMKPEKAGTGVNIRIQKQIGYNDLLTDSVYINIRDSSGKSVFSYVQSTELTVAQNEKVTDYPLIIYPYGSDLTPVTITGNKTGAPKVKFSSSENGIDIDATGVEPGVYSYGFETDGVNHGVVKITVIDPDAHTGISLGDVNGDGYIDNKDVVALFRYVSGGGVIIKDAADMNGDGYIDNKDVVTLFRMLST